MNADAHAMPRRELRDTAGADLPRCQFSTTAPSGEAPPGDGAQGPFLPDGLVVGQGQEMISNVWENEFCDKKYGEHFEWVTPWSKFRSTVAPHLVPSGQKPADVHILQVGCGNSELASALHSDGFTNVWSIDCSATVIKQMKDAHAAYHTLQYEQMDVFAMTYPSGFFDIIIDKATLEAIPSARHLAYLSELCRVLRKDGKYVLVTDIMSVARHDALTCIERQFITRADHAADNSAVVYVFIHNPQKQHADVRDGHGLSPLTGDHDDEWRAPFDDDDSERSLHSCDAQEPCRQEACKRAVIPMTGQVLPSVSPPMLLEYPDLPLDRYKAQPYFHQINTSFPGLQLIHEEPYIFVIPGFATAVECERLVLHLSTHSHRTSSATSTEQLKVRNSMQVVLPENEFSWFQSRAAALCKVSTEYLEPAKLTHYDKGQYFRSHYDTEHVQEKLDWLAELTAASSSGSITEEVRDKLLDPSGALRVHSRFITAFLYLNDVDEGGRSTFNDLGKDPGFYSRVAAFEALHGRPPLNLPPLSGVPSASAETISIKPRTGMMVVHFPSTNRQYGNLRDPNTMHEGETATDPKYMVQQFVSSSAENAQLLRRLPPRPGQKAPPKGQPPPLPVSSLGAETMADLSQSGPVLQLAVMPLPEYANLRLDRYMAQRCFHRIKTDYPGLQLIHEEPYIFVVQGFCTDEECKELRLHYGDAADRSTSAYKGQEGRRTSTQVSLQGREFPWLQQRIAKLCNVSVGHMQPAKLTRYEKGEYFRPHIDAERHDEKAAWLASLSSSVGSDGGLKEESRAVLLSKPEQCKLPNRSVTAFLYLNDVPKGGRTVFNGLARAPSFYDEVRNMDSLHQLNTPQLPALDVSRGDARASLTIEPRAGMMVVHFPSTIPDYLSVADPNTLHESEDAIDVKYIVQQFIWPTVQDAKEAVRAQAYASKSGTAVPKGMPPGM